MDKLDLEQVERITESLDEIVTDCVNKVCSGLDDYIKFVASIAMNQEQPASNVELDDFVINIPIHMYFVGDKMERTGLCEDIAKMLKDEKYREIFQNEKGTIASKNAVADDGTQDEKLIQMVYSKAYKRMKHRLDYAQEILQSIKKVISRRIAELETVKVDTFINKGVGTK